MPRASSPEFVNQVSSKETLDDDDGLSKLSIASEDSVRSLTSSPESTDRSSSHSPDLDGRRSETDSGIDVSDQQEIDFQLSPIIKLNLRDMSLECQNKRLWEQNNLLASILRGEMKARRKCERKLAEMDKIIYHDMAGFKMELHDFKLYLMDVLARDTERTRQVEKVQKTEDSILSATKVLAGRLDSWESSVDELRGQVAQQAQLREREVAASSPSKSDHSASSPVPFHHQGYPINQAFMGFGTPRYVPILPAPNGQQQLPLPFPTWMPLSPLQPYPFSGNRSPLHTPPKSKSPSNSSQVTSPECR